MQKIKVIDDLMGTGKTTAMINMIKNNPDKNYIYITPYLDEVKRIKRETSESKKMYEPTYYNGTTKLTDLHRLLLEEKNIASTHALFQRANNITRDMLRESKYILVLDEVMNVVEELHKFYPRDLRYLLKIGICSVDENHFLNWNIEMEEEEGANEIWNYTYIKEMALNRNLVCINDKLLYWNFPVDIFDLFDEVYILTYMFDCQIQRYYYDFHNIDYNKYQLDNDLNLIPYTEKYYKERKQYLKDLIVICDNDKMNAIGENKFALSVTWFNDDDGSRCKSLKKNTVNWFNNINKDCKSDFRLWTTFLTAKAKVKGNGYTKKFVPFNVRATNEYRDRYTLAYLCNVFPHPDISLFFSFQDIVINQDMYALSEFLQWIWRSAIRENNSIRIYIPSKRMRKLFIDYLEEI